MSLPPARLLAALLGALILVPAVADAAPAKRPPKPKLLLAVGAVEAATPALQAHAAPLSAALKAVIVREPLTVATLGLTNPSPAKRRWQLARRRLKGYAVTARLVALSHRLQPGTPRYLVGEAQVTLNLKRLHARAKPVEVKVTGTVTVPISVVLQAEILGARQAALQSAARAAVTAILKKLVPHRR